jgi:hypothetical protein
MNQTEEEPQGKPWKWIVGGTVLVILAILYFSGSCDRTLYHVGLNWTDCGTNGFGATYCGDDLKAYCENVSGVLGSPPRGSACEEVLD